MTGAAMAEKTILRPEQGISPDGYITDQDCFSSVRYRTISANHNGCGWVAAYNLRHARGETPDWDEVRREMDAMHRLRVPGPTLMRVMREYLAKYVPDYRETAGRREAVEAAKNSSAGIFRYQEERVPHFICFVRQEDGRFRFFNVVDGMEDAVMDMEEFAEGHFVRGNVIALTVA
jgi:hypothetical protein